MKRHHLGSFALLIFAGSVQAQSSVVMYGVIDEGLNVTSNAGGSTAYQMHNGDIFQSARLTPLHTEDWIPRSEITARSGISCWTTICQNGLAYTCRGRINM
jgi:hypothetical protein